MEPNSATSTRWWLYLSVPLFVLLSAYFLYIYYSEDVRSGKPPPPSLQTAWYSVETARGEIRQTSPTVGNCHICHAFWVPIPRTNQTTSPRFAHANLQLNHGRNDNCYSCHLITDRNKFVANDGSAIMTETPELLCARCHGLIYNDWLGGTHGKWTGSFLPATPFERMTYTCTECHDPHSPAYRYDKFAPPPTWSSKYIRIKNEGIHAGPLSKIVVGEQPEELF